MHKRFALAAALWALPAVGWAAGFEIPDNGTQALGRGGAFTAVANDGAAIEYNPAGLAQQDGLQFTLDANLFNHSVDFTRTTPAGDNDKVAIQTVHNSAGGFLAPMGALSYSKSFLPLDRLTVAFGIYGPPAVGKYTFPAGDANAAADAPNRYQLIKNDIFIAYPTLSAAYKLPIPGIFAAVGVSGQMVISDFKFNQDLYAQPTLASILPGSFKPDSSGHSPGMGGTFCPGPSGDPSCHKTATTGSPAASPTSLRLEDPIWDANVDVDVTGKKTYTAILGALVKVGPVAVGASYRPGYHLHADGTLKVSLPGMLTAPKPDAAPNGPSSTLGAQATVSGDQTSLDLDWPSVLRAGVDVDVPPVPGKLDVSADWTYETWSVVDQFVLTPHNVTINANANGTPISLPVAPVNIPKNMKNSQSYRLGVQYEPPVPVVKLQVRAGGYYEKSAIPEDFTTIDLAHFDRYAVTGGASVGINLGNFVGPLMLDLAAAYSPPVTRNVRDSGVMLTTSDPYLAKDPVGDGDYTSSVLVLSAGVRAHFGL